MSEFANYLRAQAETQAAIEAWEEATARMEIAKIRERLAEINSQHEPIATLLTKQLTERERLCRAAFYVVVGRMPPTGGEGVG